MRSYLRGDSEVSLTPTAQ